MRFLKSFLSILLLSFLLISFTPIQKSVISDDYPAYTGKDLGVSYSPLKTTFKVWAPKALSVKLRLYNTGEGGTANTTINLLKGDQGVWTGVIKQDIKNQYYTFQVLHDGKWLNEGPDMYAKAVGINGQRGMVVDLPATNPKGWAIDKKPALKNFTDIIIYELHVRDISISPQSGIKHKGKFLGITETGTKTPDGESTGLDHIKSLGVTHVHLLPSFDFNSVDEKKPPQYNWGYDPLNYNALEGSYSTDAYNGNTRIREFKQMIQTLHANGLRVILDVVYNHTSDTKGSVFNQFEPGYFYRHTPSGAYSNGTGCGNETASEQAMMRKFMVESVLYWAKEYHLDGFRFDLMGVHDIETMNQISTALHKFDPSIFIYGEGWTAGNSTLPENLQAVKKNVSQLNKIAVFNDDMRDGIKGGWSDVKSKGFASGVKGLAESVKFGITAATTHPQVDYSKVNYSKAAWAAEPYQTINYVSCHDDNTLFDRLKISNPTVSEADLIKMDKLSNAIVLTSQGVPFLHAGAEMLRSKQGIANSYNSPDSINQIDWSKKKKYKQVFKYYQQLITLRKDHPAFRMPSTKLIQEHLAFLDTNDSTMISYILKNHANGDSWKNIWVVLNGDGHDKTIKTQPGNWILAADGDKIETKGIQKIVNNNIIIAGTSAYIFYEK